MQRPKLFVAIFILMFIQGVSGVTIGLAPGSNNMGELERGETYDATFYLVTSGINQNFTVSPRLRPPVTSFMDGNVEDFNPNEASQEDISNWLIAQDSYTINPNTTTTLEAEDGTPIRASGVIDMELRVPEDAEPGYHVMGLSLNPSFGGEGEGAQVAAMGITRGHIYFRVPGEAVRDVDVLEINALRSGDNQARLDYVVKNTGTVTVEITRGRASIFSEQGTGAGQVSVLTTKLAPGEKKILRNRWVSSDPIKAGDYQVKGTLNYMTGNAYIDQSVSITDFIQVEPSTAGQVVDPDGGPVQDAGSGSLWLTLMVLVFLGVLLYAFEIDPIWIVSIVGLAAISAFVILAGLPVWLIGVVLIITVGLLYYGGI